MSDPVFNSNAAFAKVTGLPGVDVVQADAYFDSARAFVAAATADVELVELKSTRTGSVRLVTLAALKVLVT